MLDESRTRTSFLFIYVSYIALFFVQNSQNCVTMHSLYYDITITLVFAKALSFFYSPDLKEKTLFLSTENNDLFQTEKANCTWLLSRDQSQPKFQSLDSFSANQGLKDQKLVFFHSCSLLIFPYETIFFLSLSFCPLDKKCFFFTFSYKRIFT